LKQCRLAKTHRQSLAKDFQLAFSHAAAIMTHSKRRPAKNNGAISARELIV
jgi:hypothetical protein